MPSRSRVRAVVDAARRRRLWTLIVDHAGRWLFRGAVLGAAGVLVLKAGGWAGAWPVVLGGVAVCGAIAGVAAAFLRWDSPLAVAARLDEVFGLRGRLAAAVDWEGSEAAQRQDPAFVDLALRDAELAADQVRVAQAMPIKADWRWGAWPAVIAGAVALGMFGPSGPWWVTAGQKALVAKTQQERQQAGKEIATVKEILQAKPVGPTGEASAADLKHLDELQKSIEEGTKTPAEARREAVATLQKAADAVERRAERCDEQAKALRDKLAAARRASEPSADSKPGSEIGQSLSEGDYASAAKAVEQAMREMGNMPPEERKRLARELEDLSKGLASGDERPPQNGGASQQTSDAAAEAQEELRRSGASEEQAKEGAGGKDPAELQKRLEKAGVEPERAADLARRAADANRQREAEAEAQRKVDELRKALNDAAEQLREPAKSAEPAPSAGSSQGQKQDQKKDQQDAKQGGAESGPASPRKPSEQAAGDKQTDPAREGEKTGDSKPAPSGGDKSADQPSGSKPGESQSGREKTEEKARPQGAAGEKQAGERSGTPSGEQKGEQQRETPGEKAGQQPGEKPSDQAARQSDGAPSREGTAKPDGPKPDAAKPGVQPGATEPKPGGPASQTAPEKRQSGGKDPAAGKSDQPKQPGEQPAPDGRAQPSGAGQSEPKSGSKPNTKPGSQPGAASAPQDKPGESPQGAKPGEGRSDQGKSDDAKGKQPGDAAKPAPQGKPGTKPEGGQRPSTGQVPQQDGQPSPDGKGPGEQGEQSADGDPKPGDSKGQPKPNAKGPDKLPDKLPDLPKDQRGMEQLAKQIREMADQQQGAKQDRKQAEQMRELARKWWDQASQEQRDQAAKLAQELAKGRPPQSDGRSGEPDMARADQPGAGPGSPEGQAPSRESGPERAARTPKRTDTIDARQGGQRPGEGDDRVLAQWLSNKPAPGGAAPADAKIAGEQLQEAAKAAQQAVDDRVIPRRYDKLIKEFFRRAPKELGLEPGKSGEQAVPGAAAPPADASPPALPAPAAPAQNPR